MKIKTIDVNAREWFDKVNGNRYFAGDIILNYGMKNAVSIAMPFQYGHGNHFEYMAFDQLRKEKHIIGGAESVSLSRYCKENNVILRTNKQENCKKKEL